MGMLRRRRSSWILISVRWERTKRLWVPVPVWAVAEFLRGTGILLWCVPGLARLAGHSGQEALKGLNRALWKDLVAAAYEAVETLRRCGPFTLVEVSDGETAVSVRLV